MGGVALQFRRSFVARHIPHAKTAPPRPWPSGQTDLLRGLALGCVRSLPPPV
jgi:hypothetical protein